MTKEEHKHRHVELHRALDELLADWLRHHPGRFVMNGDLTMKEFLTWAHQQTIEPTEVE